MSQPLRVLHRAPVWLPQTQAWLYHQVAHLPATVESHIVADDGANFDQFGLARLHAFKAQPRSRQWGARALRKLKLRPHLGLAARVARRARVDLVHSHFGPVGCEDLPVAAAAGARHVVSFYGADASSYARDPHWCARYRELFRRADRVLAEGPHMRDTLARLGCPWEKLRVHRLGVPLTQIECQPRHWDGQTPLRVLIASGFREKKGIPLALEALARARPALPGLEITLVGDADASFEAQREKVRITDTIEAQGLGDCIRLAGLLPYRELIACAYGQHLFVAASRQAQNGDSEGGAPVLLVELLATGMLGVTTTHADIPQVAPAAHGLTVPQNDVQAITEALLALAGDAARWPQRARALRAHLDARFDAQRQGQSLARLYSELVFAGRARATASVAGRPEEAAKALK